MRPIPLYLCFYCLILNVQADPVKLGNVKLRDGRQLSAVNVLKVEPDGLRVEHQAGAGKLRIEELPESVIQKFNLSDTAATTWRQEEKARLDAAQTARRQEKIKILASASREYQESTTTSQRLAISRQKKDTAADYVLLDNQLREKAQEWQDAGRGDLAARFEDDRQLLKQQEIARPSAKLEAERDALAQRVDQLERDLNLARIQAVTNYVQPLAYPYGTNSLTISDSSSSWPVYQTHELWLNKIRPADCPPIYVSPPYCPPTSNIPPQRPTASLHSPFLPQAAACPPASARPGQTFVHPASPVVSVPNFVHGEHLWKK